MLAKKLLKSADILHLYAEVASKLPPTKLCVPLIESTSVTKCGISQCPACQGCPNETGAYNLVLSASRDSRTSTMMVAT